VVYCFLLLLLVLQAILDDLRDEDEASAMEKRWAALLGCAGGLQLAGMHYLPGCQVAAPASFLLSTPTVTVFWLHAPAGREPGRRFCAALC
jgi:hypothetical protein